MYIIWKISIFKNHQVLYYFRTTILKSALLALGLCSISSCVGVIGFFVSTSSVLVPISCPVIGSFSDVDFSLKKCFTMRSSPEWKAMIEIVHFDIRKLCAVVSMVSNAQYSSLTAILSAWKTLGRESRDIFVIISESSLVVSIGWIFLASRIFLVR